MSHAAKKPRNVTSGDEAMSRGERYSQKHGTSISQLVGDFLRALALPGGRRVGGYLPRMIRPTDAQAQAWMSQWRSAGAALARIRAAELEAVDLWRVADELEEALWARLRAEPDSRTSGLVEQQRLFARARRP